MNTSTIAILLDVEELELGRMLVLPDNIDTLELEVTYSFYDGEKQTYTCEGNSASIEIEKVNILSCYTDKSNFIPTNIQCEMINPLIDVDSIETLIWESREGMEQEEREYNYDYD